MLTRFLFLSLFFGLLIACSAPTPAPDSSPETAGPATTEPDYPPNTFVAGERFGDLLNGVTLDEIEQRYGEAFVGATLNGPEGIEYEGYLLFPDTEREVEVAGNPAEPDQGISFRVAGAESPWHSAENDLRIGMPLRELVEMNGAPITFYGFSWDYGGYVSEWNGGQLAGTRGLRLDWVADAEDYRLPEGAESVMGDQPVSSDNPILAGMDVRVREFTIDFPGE